MDALIDTIHFLSLTVYLIAVIALTQFYWKVRQEKYWAGFPVAFLFLLFHEIFEILNDNYGVVLFGQPVEFLAEICEIIGAIVLTLSVYYLIRELRKINAIELADEKE